MFINLLLKCVHEGWLVGVDAWGLVSGLPFTLCFDDCRLSSGSYGRQWRLDCGLGSLGIVVQHLHLLYTSAAVINRVLAILCNYWLVTCSERLIQSKKISATEMWRHEAGRDVRLRTLINSNCLSPSRDICVAVSSFLTSSTKPHHLSYSSLSLTLSSLIFFLIQFHFFFAHFVSSRSF